MSLKKLITIQEIIREAKENIIEEIGHNFSLDLSIDECEANKNLITEAKELDWKPGKYDGSEWFEKSDEYGGIYVNVN